LTAAIPTLAQGTVSPRLERALAAEAFSGRDDDGRVAVWVYFRDKGVTGAELEQALLAAEARLPERTAWRRAKVRPAGQLLVDIGDLPLHAPYLEQVAELGATLRRESRWLNAASFQVSDDQLRQLAALPWVVKLDLVARFSRPEIPTPPEVDAEVLDQLDERKDDRDGDNRWDIDYGANRSAMEQANVPPVHELGITGAGVIIGMLDSGFRTTHEALENIPILATYDFVNDDEIVDNEPGDPENSNDHGTKTLSTAMGNMPGSLVAPAFGASAILAKTEDVSQEIPIEEDQWVAGLEFAEGHGADIISSSLGYYDWYDFPDLDGNTAVTTIAADLAVARGVVVVNSAGNERNTAFNHIIAPSDGDSVIAVGAVTSSGAVTSFSSPGPSYDGRIKPDVSALGSGNPVAKPTDDHGYTTASGTSFSCPLTSGVAALILARAPGLTPLQVREALRETAHLADNPDNDYGWGIIDALAAVTYFGPSFVHQPLVDTEDTTGPYFVAATITDREGVDGTSVSLNYRLDGGFWERVTLLPTGDPDTWAGAIPGQPAGAIVEYYLEAASINAVTTTLPPWGAESPISFRVGPDETLPLLIHEPLRDQAYIQWPPVVRCTATDNLGIDRVELTYQHNGGPVTAPAALGFDGGDAYSLTFPLEQLDVAIGDQIIYNLTAWDAAGIPNATVAGPHTFEVIDTLGLVLVLADQGSGKTDDKVAKDKSALVAVEGRSSAATIADWLTAAGYVADVIPAAGVTVADFESYHVVLLAAGNNTSPLADPATRDALRAWASAGGKIIIEGGEVGYDVLTSPGYPEFAAEVLHAVDWESDNAGNLETVSGQEFHPILTQPHELPGTLGLDYSGYGDQDAVEVAGDSYRIMAPANFLQDAGIYVYDDNSAPQSAQIVVFTVNVEAISGGGAALLENTLDFLMAAEPAPTASMSGRVVLTGEGNYGGVLVSVGGGHETTTTTDGLWLLAGLYGGSYELMVSFPGFETARLEVELADGEQLTELEIRLNPVIQTHYAATPQLPIPDSNPGGVISMIAVPAEESGLLSAVSVDIEIHHTWIGDLTVALISPGGTTVTLHNRSGSSSHDIVGNWPATLTVDGPGDLLDLLGEDNAGDWTLFVSDSAGSDTGVLESWGLHFTIPGVVSAVGDGGPPSVTRLYPNVPNPFNPQTEIVFELARAGNTRLSIFDVRGMLVTRLLDEELAAGSHRVRWDGRDGAGRGVGSGTYLYRLESGEVVAERKMLLVR